MSISVEVGRCAPRRTQTRRPTRQSRKFLYLEPHAAPLDLLEQLADLSRRAMVPPANRTEIRHRLLRLPALVACAPPHAVAALYLVPSGRAMVRRDELLMSSPAAHVCHWRRARHLNVAHCELDPRFAQGRLLFDTVQWGLEEIGRRLGWVPRLMTYTPVIGLRAFCMQLCAAPEQSLWPTLMRLSESGMHLDLVTLACRLGNLQEVMQTLAFGTRRQRDAVIARDRAAAEAFLGELARVYLCEVCRTDTGACLCPPVHWHRQAGARLVRIRALSWLNHQDALSVVAHLEYRPDRMADLAQRYADLAARRARPRG